MAVVHCRNSNGLILRLYEMVKGPLGIEQSRPIGGPVELRSGRNEIDDTFIAAWLERNKNGDLIKDGVVHIEKATPPAETSA